MTEIKTLIRDPYAIYAKHVLGVRPLLPINPRPDARRKGIVFHSILEAFFSPESDFTDFATARARLADIIDAEFRSGVPWAATASSWRGIFTLIADPLIAAEQHRRQTASPVAAETIGSLVIPEVNFTIKGKADRLDRYENGSLVIYDYKTGTLPTAKQVRYFDRQLLIEFESPPGTYYDALPERIARLGINRIDEDIEVLRALEILVDGEEDHSE